VWSCDNFKSFDSQFRGAWWLGNNIVFRGACANVSSLMNQIVSISWFWFIGRIGRNVNVLFSDWYNNFLVASKDFFLKL
jgi:hypothetical protein